MQLASCERVKCVAMNEDEQKKKALRWLREAVGDDSADFHEGQWEAIDALANRRERIIVVQRTGWGKSSVYFIATRLLREQHDRGPTLIISPLLALMRNQVEAATKLGIHSAALNSTNPKEWENITADILQNKVVHVVPITVTPKYSYGTVCLRLSVCHKSGVLSKRLKKASWFFLACELPSTCRTVYCYEIQVSPKISVLLFGTSS